MLVLMRAPGINDMRTDAGQWRQIYTQMCDFYCYRFERWSKGDERSITCMMMGSTIIITYRSGFDSIRSTVGHWLTPSFWFILLILI